MVNNETWVDTLRRLLADVRANLQKQVPENENAVIARPLTSSAILLLTLGCNMQMPEAELAEASMAQVEADLPQIEECERSTTTVTETVTVVEEQQVIKYVVVEPVCDYDKFTRCISTFCEDFPADSNEHRACVVESCDPDCNSCRISRILCELDAEGCQNCMEQELLDAFKSCRIEWFDCVYPESL